MIASLSCWPISGFLLAQLPASRWCATCHSPTWCGWRGERHPLERSGRPSAIRQRVADPGALGAERLVPAAPGARGLGPLWRAWRPQRSGVVGWSGTAFGRDITLNAPASWVLGRVPMRPPFP